MKKILSVVLACAIFIMIGCGSDQPSTNKRSSKKKIEKTSKEVEVQTATDEG